MEYQFTHTLNGVIAHCSMEHEALGYWINSEISQQPQQLKLILEHINLAKHNYPNVYEWEILGKEYSLYISGDEVMIKANHIDYPIFSEEEYEETLFLYEQENIAILGLDDFEQFLLSYLNFTKVHVLH